MNARASDGLISVKARELQLGDRIHFFSDGTPGLVVHGIHYCPPVPERALDFIGVELGFDMRHGYMEYDPNDELQLEARGCQLGPET